MILPVPNYKISHELQMQTFKDEAKFQQKKNSNENDIKRKKEI